MNSWVMTFVGDHARENHEITRRTKTFCVSSSETLIQRARPGERALLYLAGQGFVGRAEVSSSARAPDGAPEWSSKDLPMWQLSIENLQPFPQPIPYKFPDNADHPILGFHRHGLAHGFLAIPEAGFEDVLGRAGQGEARAEEAPAVAVASAAAGEMGPRPTPPPVPVEPGAHYGGRKKRVAGQHALSEGRRRVALWTLAEMAASLFKIEGARKYARDRARAAEKT